ncbi:OsmC family protein [Pleomorphovibrio marinus]|uniref:OsmC family protein n=1 Tax=Pleomorphovibrio marinus TaxID=2164132 RepID=UPI000E0B67A3|nr:OsmC family protein [Pleomorphovibrio marinus]
MAKKKITLTMKADKEYEAVNESGNRIGIDMYDGEGKRHQSPMELLLSALAGCSAVDAVQMMKKKRRTITSFETEAIGERREGIPAYYTAIHLSFILTSPDATEEEFAKVIKLAVEKYCSVASSLKPEITFESKIVNPT